MRVEHSRASREHQGPVSMADVGRPTIDLADDRPFCAKFKVGRVHIEKIGSELELPATRGSLRRIVYDDLLIDDARLFGKSCASGRTINQRGRCSANTKSTHGNPHLTPL